MISLGAFVGSFIIQLPVLAVLLTGLVLLLSTGRRLPGRASGLATAGLVLMLAETVASLAWSAVMPQLIAQSSYSSGFVRNFGYVSALVGFLLSALFAVGLGMVVAALVRARRGEPQTAPAAPGSLPPGR